MAEENQAPATKNFQFKPISPDLSLKSLQPNFTKVDIGNPEKNLKKFDDFLVNAGLQAARNIILKNTLSFFQTPVKKQDLNRYKQDSNFTQASQQMTPVGYGKFGFPILSNLFIYGDTYYDNYGKPIAKFNDIRIDAILMDVEIDKNIIVTDVQGRNGSFIEYVSSKSRRISFYGTFLADTMNIYPEADIAEFIRCVDSNRAVKVDSWYLRMFGIYYIFIKKARIWQEEGSQEYQRFEFEAISDTPVQLKISRSTQ